MPLNVSREMLQQNSSLKTIKKKLVRKALDMIRRIADEDPNENNKNDETGMTFDIFYMIPIGILVSSFGCLLIIIFYLWTICC